MDLLDIVYEHGELNRLVVDEVSHLPLLSAIKLISKQAHCISVNIPYFSLPSIFKTATRNGAMTFGPNTVV